MIDGFRKFFAPPTFPDNEEKTRAAELLNEILNFLTLVPVLGFVGVILDRTARPAIIAAIPVFLLLLLALRIPTRQGHIKLVSIIIVILLTSVVTLSMLIGGSIRTSGIVFYTVASVISGLLINRTAIFWSVSINAVIVFGIMWAENAGRLPAPDSSVNILQGVIFTAASLLTAVVLNLALKRQNEAFKLVHRSQEQLVSANTELEQRVMDRTARLDENVIQLKKRALQLEAVAKTARSAATAQNMKTLLTSITKEISSNLGYYHVGIFLLDSTKEYAILSAANSEGGQNMLARGHSLKVGEQGIVGYATYSGNPHIALDVGEDPVFFNNPDLPETHSEVALPLKFGYEIIGALDIQSTESNSFSRDDLEIFSVLADQVSVAIQNTRLLEQAQRALKEAEIATSHLTGQGWKDYAETTSIKGYRYDGIKPEPMRETSKSINEKDALFVPVQLRGKTIGRLKLKAIEQSRKWTEDELAIIESTAERVAIALDGARLLDDAQRRASRETFLSEVAAKLGTSFQLDSILRDTVEELGQTLKGSIVSFQLVNPSALPSEEKDKRNSKNEKQSE